MQAYRGNSQDGMGLVEIMVAMMLFAIIVVAAAPVLVNSLRMTAASAASAQAAKLANEVIADARVNSADCAAFLDFVNTPIPDFTDERGNAFVFSVSSQIQETGELDACTDESHPTQWLQVDVRRGASGDDVASVRTVLAVPGLL